MCGNLLTTTHTTNTSAKNPCVRHNATSVCGGSSTCCHPAVCRHGRCRLPQRVDQGNSRLSSSSLHGAGSAALSRAKRTRENGLIAFMQQEKTLCKDLGCGPGKMSWDCSCDAECIETYHDCCSDYQQSCPLHHETDAALFALGPIESCAGRCAESEMDAAYSMAECFVSRGCLWSCHDLLGAVCWVHSAQRWVLSQRQRIVCTHSCRCDVVVALAQSLYTCLTSVRC